MFQLARDMREWNVEALARQMSWRTFTNWQAFYEVDALLQKEISSGKPPNEAVKIVEALVALHDG